MLPPPPTGQLKEQKMGGGKGNSGNGGAGVSDPESAPMMQTDVPSYREMLICSNMMADSLWQESYLLTYLIFILSHLCFDEMIFRFSAASISFHRMRSGWFRSAVPHVFYAAVPSQKVTAVSVSGKTELLTEEARGYGSVPSRPAQSRAPPSVKRLPRLRKSWRGRR